MEFDETFLCGERGNAGLESEEEEENAGERAGITLVIVGVEWESEKGLENGADPMAESGYEGGHTWGEILCTVHIIHATSIPNIPNNATIVSDPRASK